MTIRPDPIFYASSRLATDAPPESFLFLMKAQGATERVGAV
jgi:hypothetical protein